MQKKHNKFHVDVHFPVSGYTVCSVIILDLLVHIGMCTVQDVPEMVQTLIVTKVSHFFAVSKPMKLQKRLTTKMTEI